MRREGLLGFEGDSSEEHPGPDGTSLYTIWVTIWTQVPAAPTSGETQDSARCKQFSCQKVMVGKSFQWMVRWRSSH